MTATEEKPNAKGGLLNVSLFSYNMHAKADLIVLSTSLSDIINVCPLFEPLCIVSIKQAEKAQT